MLLRQGTPVYAYDFTRRNVIPEWEFVKHEGVRRKELVPRASDSDYWRDVGTLEQYWLANLDLVQPQPKFNVYGEHFPLFAAPGHFPPAKFVHEMPGRTGIAVNSIVADGVIVSGATVRESVLGCGVYVHSWATDREVGAPGRRASRGHPHRDEHRAALPGPQRDHRQERPASRRTPRSATTAPRTNGAA